MISSWLLEEMIINYLFGICILIHQLLDSIIIRLLLRHLLGHHISMDYLLAEEVISIIIIIFFFIK